VIANFHGHLHSLYVTDISGTTVKRIAVPNACFGRNNEYGTEATTYNKTDNGTGKNTAFNVVSIDLTKKIIYADCFGAGYDRIISYGEADVTAYSVTNNLSNASTSNGATTVTAGSKYSAAITANSGYELSSIKVTMGGTDITSTVVSGSNITIANVTGNIVITVTTVQTVVPPSYTNLVPTSKDASGAVYNGKGYKEKYRLSSSGEESQTNGAVVSGFIPYSGQIIRAWGSTSANAGTSGNYVGFYDASHTKLHVLAGTHSGVTYTAVDGKYQMLVDPAGTLDTVKPLIAQAKYIRCSFGVCADPAAFIVTLDEPIE
jgi:hypothetical protein